MNNMQTTTHVEAQRSITSLGISMCALAAIFYCYEYYLRVAPSVMTAELKDAFNLSEAGFGHLAAFYYYAYTPMQIPVGMLMDRFGPRRILTLACALCVVGTYFFAGNHGLTTAQFGRFLVGFGSAFAYVGVLKIASIWLPQKYFAMMAGLATALGMFGAISGQLTMAYMLEHLGWQPTLFYAAGVGVFLSIVMWIMLRDNGQSSHQKLATKTVFEGLWSILKNWQMWINGVIGCFTFMILSVFAELWALPFLMNAGLSRADAALGTSLIFLGFAIGGPLWGLLSDAMRSRRIPLIVGSFLSAILLTVAIKGSGSLPVYAVYCLLFLSGFASSVENLVFAIGVDLNPKPLSATSAAFTNMVVMLGGAILPPLIGVFLDQSSILVDGLPTFSREDFANTLLILPACLILAGILSYFTSESYHHHE